MRLKVCITTGKFWVNEFALETNFFYFPNFGIGILVFPDRITIELDFLQTLEKRFLVEAS